MLTTKEGRRDYDGDLDTDDAAEVFDDESRFKAFVDELMAEQISQWKADGTWAELARQGGRDAYVMGFREAIEDNLLRVIKQHVAEMLAEALEGLKGEWRIHAPIGMPYGDRSPVPMHENQTVILKRRANAQERKFYDEDWIWVREGKFKDIIAWLEEQPR